LLLEVGWAFANLGIDETRDCGTKERVGAAILADLPPTRRGHPCPEGALHP
jgi:hypothetical protein